jgi:DNA-binding transcriptional ArsR family regulator
LSRQEFLSYHRRMTARVEYVGTGEGLQALAHPQRLRILEALRTPESAAGVARALGQTRQGVNYHLKELERAGLVRPAGERRRGNLVEPLYEAIAGTFVVSPRATWSGQRRASALREQVALEHLVDVGETLQRDAAALLDRAAFDGEEIASAAITADVTFATDAARAAFMEEFLQSLGPLLKKHGARRGQAFRLVCAVHPRTEEAP